MITDSAVLLSSMFVFCQQHLPLTLLFWFTLTTFNLVWNSSRQVFLAKML